MSANMLFRRAVTLSLLVHGALLAYRASEEEPLTERVVPITVMLREPAPPAPPPPPSLQPQPQPQPKPEKVIERKRPKPAAEPITEVVETRTVEGDGQRAGELVDIEVGRYRERAADPARLPARASKPKPRPKPKVDKGKLARAYLKKLRSVLVANMKYPVTARRIGLEGTVTVAFVVRQDASFSNVVVKRSSGHGVLDRAAIETVTQLSGSVPRPARLGARELRTAVALKYELDA